MGDIIPFISRLVGRLDWSAGEKARLQHLADKLSQGDLDLEVVFGRSDQGEPWCAVTGQDQEVLVHIARIGGRFVVHHIAQDVFETGSSLWAAVERALGEAWGEVVVPALAEVVPIDAHARQTHILSALVVAAILVEAELEPSTDVPPDLPAAIPLPESPLTEGLGSSGDETAAAVQGRANVEEPMKPFSGATKLAPMALYESDEPAPTLANQAPTPPRIDEPAPSTSAETTEGVHAEAEPDGPRLAQLLGGEGDDEITGTQAAELLIGGAGDDTLNGGGAPEGTLDWLQGGAGDDLLVLDARVVADGGPGADRFLFTARPDRGSEQLLGRVIDFRPSQGDSLTSGVLVTATPEADILDGTDPPAGLLPPGPLPGYRLGMDFDGDGRADGEVLLSGAEVGGFVAAKLAGRAGSAPPEAAPPAEPAIRPPDPEDASFLF